MKRKVHLRIRRVTPGQAYAVLSALSAVFCVMYVGFFAATMGYAAERESLRDDIASLSTEISEAELVLLDKSRSLTETVASERGLVAAAERRYAAPTSLSYVPTPTNVR